MLARLTLIVLSIFSTATLAQDDSETTPKSLEQLVGDLSRLDLLQFDGGSEGIKKRQRKKIDLADQVLVHPELQEPFRVFAMISRLQSFGVIFSIDNEKGKSDEELNQEYAEAIEEALSDPAKEVALEATTSNASFRGGLFRADPTDSNAEAAAKAFQELNEFQPKIPIVQTSRRLLLEQIWKHENAKLFFEKMTAFDEKLSKIAIDQIVGKTTKEKADFLWTKHFARLDDVFSMRRIATMYENGTGTRKNYSQSARWYTALSQLGDLRSKLKLGDYYFEGKGFSQNPKRAIELYRECGQAGSRVAKFKLAQCYLSGTGVEQSEEDWKRLLNEAADEAKPIDVEEIYTSIDFANAADSYRVFYEALVEQNPDDIFYLNNLAYSLLISKKKDPEKSLELVERAIKNAPEAFSGMSNFVDTKANALKQLGKIKEAAEMFESILEDIDDKQSVLKSLVECYEELDSEKAEKYREQLSKLSK